MLGFDFYVFGVRKLKKGCRCGVHTVGRVAGSSAINYGGIHIPLVEYAVDGKVYKVAGPKFRSGVAVRISTPFGSPEARVETNLTTRENLPLHLKVKMRRNSLQVVTSLHCSSYIRWDLPWMFFIIPRSQKKRLSKDMRACLNGCLSCF